MLQVACEIIFETAIGKTTPNVNLPDEAEFEFNLHSLRPFTQFAS